jgi:CheY-like chemotaxis protein
LRDADRRKDEFLATLAHELRGPLAPVMNSLELLDRGGDDAAVARRARDILRRQLSHMVRLVDDLLDVGRISRDKIELRKQRVELRAVVAHAVESCNPLVHSLGHELTIALPPEPIFLEADEARLTQIVGNLLNNACKYTPAPGRIALAAARDGGDVVLRVTDTGIGIPHDQLASVFDLFSQLGRSVEQQHGGLGIGLYLVRRLVELHGGSVEARSDGAEQGSEFIVRLPRLPDAAAVARPASATHAPHAPARRFLVVDDNVDTATSLEILLSIHGHETRIAHDGMDALAAAERWHPDVALLDIGLPQLNGYEVCRRMRERPWGKKVVMVALTGWGQERDRQQSQDAGFDLHLVKPVTFSALMELLGAHVAAGGATERVRSPVIEQPVHGNAAHRDVQP